MRITTKHTECRGCCVNPLGCMIQRWVVALSRGLGAVGLLVVVGLVSTVSRSSAADGVGSAHGEAKLCEDDTSIAGSGAQGVRGNITMWDLFTDGNKWTSVLDVYIGSARRGDGASPKLGAFVGFSVGKLVPPGKAVAFLWMQTIHSETNNTLHILPKKDFVASPGQVGQSAQSYPARVEAVSWEPGTNILACPLNTQWWGKITAKVVGREIPETWIRFFEECNLPSLGSFPPHPFPEPDHWGACTVGAGGGTNRDPRGGWYFGDFAENEFKTAAPLSQASWQPYEASQVRNTGSHHHVYKPVAQTHNFAWGACGHDEGRYGPSGPCPPNNTEEP